MLATILSRRAAAGTHGFSSCSTMKPECSSLVGSLLKLEQRAASVGRLDTSAWSAAVQACGKQRASAQGRRLHQLAVSYGLHKDSYLVGQLIIMYGKCGLVEEATKLHQLHQNSAYAWSALLRACTHNGQHRAAVALFGQMLRLQLKPTFNTFIPLVTACTVLEDLETGRWVHSHITEWDLRVDPVLGNGLITMYRRCSSLQDAKMVFEQMPVRDVVSWNAMIAAYLDADCKQQALELFRQMQRQGVKPSNISYITVLDSCLGLLSLEEARLIHAEVVAAGLDKDVMVGTALLHMYGKFGKLVEAKAVFGRLEEDRNVVAWTAMVAACSQNGSPSEGLGFFRLMQQHGIKPNSVTFISALNSCTSAAKGAVYSIWKQVKEAGFAVDEVLGTALLSAYGRCNQLEEAELVFNELNKNKDVVSWNAMVAAYIQNGQYESALFLFHEILVAGLRPTSLTFVTLLGGVQEPEQGKLLLAVAAEAGNDKDLVVGNAFLSMFARCGTVEQAKEVFDKMSTKDVISWNALMGALTQSGQSKQALELFYSMDVKADNISFVAALDASSDSTSLLEGKRIHARILELGLDEDPVIQNALLNMYAKCGSLDMARHIFFDGDGQRCVVSWTTLVAAYSQHGEAAEALKLFRQMQQSGVRPNEVTFISALAACNHAGLLEEGCVLFSAMVLEHGLSPSSKHFSCLVDLLGRSGRTQEAEKLLFRMPFQREVVAWMALLGACKSARDVDRGQRCADKILELDPGCSAAYSNLANLQADGVT